MDVVMDFWIGTSWKMNKTLGEAMAFVEELTDAGTLRQPHIQPFVIPPFTTLREVGAALRGCGVKVGAQNMHWADSGAWTGEISPLMLKDCGAELVELGHAERRAHFGETDDTVALKVEAAVRHGLTPLICLGETLADREGGRTEAVLDRQLSTALGRLDGKLREAPILLVYEPVWAIGENNVSATAVCANETQAHITAIAEHLMGRRILCLYGGSVNADNCVELVSQPHVDGLFIGRSAWNASGFLDIFSRCAAAISCTEDL